MASSLTLKRLVLFLASSLTALLSVSFLRPVATSPSSRQFNTNALTMMVIMKAAVGIDDRPSRRSLARSRDDFLSDVIDPFSPTRSLSHNGQIHGKPTRLCPPCRWTPPWMGCAGDRNALNLRIDMPGLGKEDVKVSVEQNSLVIKGEGAMESDDEENARRYSSRIDLPEKIYKTDEIKAEMKKWGSKRLWCLR
ncbi:LOW QUALITY PROTEIN: hypothetical protein NC651_009772 [Populus alba x Populus x berolinensis]|nr:LOW QUALITY PROTEIN: hypothetical protein NC651_009772 [Populus alba x Populus x berolinensis]